MPGALPGTSKRALAIEEESPQRGDVNWGQFPPLRAPLCPAGHLPHEGGDRPSRLGFANRRRCRKSGGGNGRPISPRVGEMSGRTEGGAKGHRPVRRPVRVWMDFAPHPLPMKKVRLQKQSTTSKSANFLPLILSTPLRTSLIILAIALAGTGPDRGSGRAAETSLSRVRCPGDPRARDRPAVPGCWVTDSISEKRMLGQSRHRGNRGEAARVSSTGPAPVH